MKNITSYINEGSYDCLNKIFAKNAEFPMECEIPVLDPETIKEKKETVKIVYAVEGRMKAIICEFANGYQDYYWANREKIFKPLSEPDMTMGEWWEEEDMQVECPKEYADKVACMEY